MMNSQETADLNLDRDAEAGEPVRVLEDKQVAMVRKMYGKGYSVKDISEIFDLPLREIRKILNVEQEEDLG